MNPGHWFEELADHMGGAYLRYSFTKGTVQEVDFLVEELPIRPGDRVLDIGCGPGRHTNELARRGMVAHGIDISSTFIDIARRSAPDGATFQQIDARLLESTGVLDVGTGFDAVVCLCQGAFGLMTADGDDLTVLRGMAAHARPGARLALSAFSAYYSVRYHDEARFDAQAGVSHERTEVRNAEGEAKEVSLWTGCYTPRELRMLLPAAGWGVDAVYSVEPGRYGRHPATVESPEFLVVGRRL